VLLCTRLLRVWVRSLIGGVYLLARQRIAFWLPLLGIAPLTRTSSSAGSRMPNKRDSKAAPS
jgi:hypothetical protein